ncbi:MAG: xylulokinase [Planctomycetales bacterium]
MSIFLGIDIGTSGTKTLAMREDGRIVAKGTVEYPLSSPRPGWAEQAPEDWWQGAIRSVRAVLRAGKIKGAEISGIGLSGQMHGSVFLDARGQVIRPALLWNDQRTEPECRQIEERVGGRKRLIELVANPALTGFTAPKILWLRNHEPANFDRLAQVLLPKDYVRYRLTGEFATEVSDASGTLLLDVRNRRWSRQMLERLELDPDLLPAVFESEEVSGRVSREAAALLGIPAGVPVVGGGGDQAAGGVGNGIVRSGVISATMGTSGVVFAHSDEVQIDPRGRLHTFCHAVRGKWHVMGVVLSAGGSLQWYRNQFAAAEMAQARRRKIDPYELLTALASEAPAGCEGLYFLPYLTGERTPYVDPQARGAWVGLSLRHGRAHLIRSIMEGATYALRDSLEIVREMGVPIKEVRLSGGGARSPFWRQMQADVFGVRGVTTNSQEGPAYGAALLAAVGTGAFHSVVEACRATIAIEQSVSPDAKARRTYALAYPEFQSLYRSLRGNFQTISELVRRSLR